MEYLDDLKALEDAAHMLIATIRKHVPGREALEENCEGHKHRHYSAQEDAIGSVERAVKIAAGAIVMKQAGHRKVEM